MSPNNVELLVAQNLRGWWAPYDGTVFTDGSRKSLVCVGIVVLTIAMGAVRPSAMALCQCPVQTVQNGV